MFKKTIICVSLSFLMSGVSNAQEPMSADEVKELFTNKTFNIHNRMKDRRLQGYDDEDGNHFVFIPWKDKVKKRKWWVEGNKHCTSHPKRGDSCKDMISVGGGKYHGITDGEHTHTLSEFREGRDFDR